MNKKALSLAICLAMALPTASQALSLGDIESRSSLNQPFQGRINLLSTTPAEAKTLRVRVAPVAVFNRVGIDRPAFLNSIRFRTTIQNGKPVILVSSNQPINEPFLNFLLEVSWPNGQLLKEYTVLLDPPVLMRPNTAIASNNAGVRAEPRAQGRITRPQQRRVAPQPQRRVQRRTPQQVRQAQYIQREVTATQRKRAQQQRQLLAAQRKLAAEDNVTTASRTRVSSYRVRRGDTLSKVAKKIGYRGVRKDQMMVALFEKNRRAFSLNNMNNLKAGVLITRPSLQATKAVKYRKARAQVLAQARDWKQTRVASTSKAAKPARIEVVGSKQTLDKGAKAGSSSTGLNNKITQLTESLTTKQKENEELKSRVSELESLLRNKNRLIKLKSEQLAGLQDSMQTESNAASVEVPKVETVETPKVDTTETPEAVVNAEIPAEVTGDTDIQQEVANALSNENGEIIRAETSPEAENVEQPAAETEATAEEEAAPSEVESEGEGFDIMALLEDPKALGVGGGALLALFGGFLFMRRRKAAELVDTDDFAQDDTDVSTDALDITTKIDDSEIYDESEYVTHDEIVTTEETNLTADEAENELDDIVQEADVYIVYGLHDQAESEIRRALKDYPESAALHAKLLENYQAAGDKEVFEKEAKAFLELDIKDKDKYWDDICNWGRALLPGNQMFEKSESSGISGAGAAAAAAATAGVAMIAGTAVADADDTKSDDVGSTGLFSEDMKLDDLISDDEVITDQISSNTDFESMDIEVDDIEIDDSIEDFDFDDVLSENSNVTEASLEDDFDMNFDDDNAFNSLLSDTDDKESTEEVVDLADDIVIETDLDSTNLNLDLDADDFDKLMPEDHAYKTTDIDKAKDSAEDTMAELSKADSEESLLSDFDNNLSFLDLDDSDGDIIEETQVETKIDLAKAYIDMGDIDGARSTLEEVIEEGSEDQKREAEELLQHNG